MSSALTVPSRKTDRINPLASVWRGRRVGLLGGSFNPAHHGHLLISRMALSHLALDEVWWMVSPQNPLKTEEGMASLDDRIVSAQAAAQHPRIRVTDIETRLGTRFTADTLVQLQAWFPATHFVWLMGADNMQQISRWQDWTAIFETVPVAVFGRPDYSIGAMTSTAARRFAKRRVLLHQARALADLEPPAWTFIHYRHDPISATAIRAAAEAGVTSGGRDAD